MYSLVLMAALTTGADTPNFCFGCWGCHGCCGCCGCYGCGCGCCGCCGCYGCHCGCWGGWSCCGCYGCHCCGGYSCCGCCGCGCYGNNGGGVIYTAPAGGAPVTTEPEKLPPPKKTDKPADSQAKLIIDVPADAKLYIDSTLMKATSERRTFNTPQLKTGTLYFYDLKAEMVVDGKTYTDTKRVTLKAGDTVRASFTDLASKAPASTVASAEK